jgi:F-type H+-transporting ATPase subunit beta
VLRGGVAGMIETGIKVVDLFGPLVRGGTAGCIARPGVGQMAVVAEILRRLRVQRVFSTIVWLPRDPTPAPDDLLPEATATGATLDEICEQVVAARDDYDVVVAADREYVLSGELFQLREQLREPGSRPISYVLFDSLGETPDVEGAPYGPLEAVVRFDLDLALRGLWPAVDPLQSTSVLLEGAQVEAAHLTLATRARALLRRYQELRALVPKHGLEKLPPADTQRYHRGQRLEAFLTQPFYIAEPFTGRPGVWVPLPETLDGVRRILDGAADDLEPEALQYLGALPASSGSGR